MRESEQLGLHRLSTNLAFLVMIWAIHLFRTPPIPSHGTHGNQALTSLVVIDNEVRVHDVFHVDCIVNSGMSSLAKDLPIVGYLSHCSGNLSH
jgi:hypothetical protein